LKKIIIPSKVGIQRVINFKNFSLILMTMILSYNNNMNKKTEQKTCKIIS